MTAAQTEVDMRVDLAGIALRNPVLTASGTFGYGTELAPFLDLTRIGGFVAKSLTPEPRIGNPPPRIAEVSSGMLNAISLENVGVAAFLEEKLPAIPAGIPVIASVFGTSPEQYVEVCQRLADEPRVAGLELNASCPHVKAGGIEFGQDPVALGSLVRQDCNFVLRITRCAGKHPHDAFGRRRHERQTIREALIEHELDLIVLARDLYSPGSKWTVLCFCLQSVRVDRVHRQRTTTRSPVRQVRPVDVRFCDAGKLTQVSIECLPIFFNKPF